MFKFTPLSNSCTLAAGFKLALHLYFCGASRASREMAVSSVPCSVKIFVFTVVRSVNAKLHLGAFSYRWPNVALKRTGQKQAESFCSIPSFGAACFCPAA
jgi:hypothetical protein